MDDLLFGQSMPGETPSIFRGVVKRIKGWCKKNEISPSNIFIDHDSLLLGEQGSVESFINYYKANNFHRGMIIIDTFNMACPNIEENSAKEMSGVITKAKLIAEKLNSTVLIIHHSGKDESRGMRGSSSLKASMDTIIYVKQDGVLKETINTKSSANFMVKLKFQIKYSINCHLQIDE